MTPTAPYIRPLYGPADKRHVKPGVDVVAVKRGLARAGFLTWPKGGHFDGDYNRRAVEAVKLLQTRAHIKPTGHYGHATHEALRLSHRKGHASEAAFDAFALSLLAQAAHVHAAETAEVRAARALEDAAGFWIVHRDESHYAQVRPFPLLMPPAILVRTDCSGFSTACFFVAGAPDPNGPAYRYSGYGYTGSLVGQGAATTKDKAGPGCLAFYGHTPPERASAAFPVGSPTHVATCLSAGYIASDGQESGPSKYDLDYRSDFHSVRRYPLVKED